MRCGHGLVLLLALAWVLVVMVMTIDEN